MQSTNDPLPNQKRGEISSVVSDDDRQRDAGETVATTSAAPAGCWADEAEPKADEEPPSIDVASVPAGCWAEETDQKPADAFARSSVSETAPGGPSDNSSEVPAKPAESIKSQRDFEAFLRASGFSRAASKALAAGGWQSIGGPDTDAPQHADTELLAQMKEFTQWMTGKSKKR